MGGLRTDEVIRDVIPFSRRTVLSVLGGLLPCALAVCLPAPGALAVGAARTAMDATSAQRLLDGKWVGDDATWVIDTHRLQVNTDPEKPFEWRALQLVNVSGQMVIFDVGKMRCIALLATPDLLQITSFGFVGEKLLRRAVPPIVKPAKRRPARLDPAELRPTIEDSPR